MRTPVIVARLLPLVVSFLRDHRRWIVFGAPIARTREFHERRATRLVATAAKLGPTFVKLGQVFASRADLVPEPYLSAIGTLTDQVPPISYEAVAATIEASYGLPIESLFDSFERVPLAAASLGQVHRGRYKGEDVVAKVLRPGVEELVAADVKAADRILGYVEHWWPNRHVIAIRGMVAEFGRRVPEEMDFRLEADHAVAIRRNFASRSMVVVPRVIEDMTRQHVLVLEYVEGRRIDALGEWITEHRIDARSLVQHVMELYIQMMLVDGLFHADPHPGNLLVARDGRLILLDFGMVVRVPRQTRLDLVRTVFAAVRNDVEGILDGFKSLGIIEPGADMIPLRALAVRLLALSTVRSTVPERIETLLADEVLAELYDAPVSLPSDMVYFARTAALIEGLGTRYDPYFNALEFATPIALRMHGRIMASLREGAPPSSRPDEWATGLGTLLGEVANVVTRAGREIAALVGASFLGAPSLGRRIDPPRDGEVRRIEAKTSA